MELIIGLGNPGKKYDNTWHNLGFAAVEELRSSLGLPPFRKSAKFGAEITKGVLNDGQIILAKPLTYMNESGKSVQAIAAFFKIPAESIVAIHDDIDLPLGRLRLAKDSSAGGHNGVKSLIEQLGTSGFRRVKIGVKTPKLEIIGAADYVLRKLDKDERDQAKAEIEKAAEAAKDIMALGLEKAMSKWN